MVDKTRPIMPNEVVAKKKDLFPSEAFEAFNELITEHFTSGSAIIKQKDVVALMVQKGLDKDEIFKNGWLDVKTAYRAAGWKVVYDKPAYNETYDEFYDATFTFTNRTKTRE